MTEALMAAGSLARVRFAGGFLAILGLAIVAGGYAFVCMALNWPMPDWVPASQRVVPQGPALDVASLRQTPLGFGAGYLAVFGALACLNGFYMLARGRRTWVLGAPLFLMFLGLVFLAGWAQRHLPG
jgi:hypothetical protein